MLKISLKKEEALKIGDNIFIKSASDGRVQLIVDAPREVKVNRVQLVKIENGEELQKK